MKKLISLAVAASMIFFAGCSSVSPQTENNTTASASVVTQSTVQTTINTTTKTNTNTEKSVASTSAAQKTTAKTTAKKISATSANKTEKQIKCTVEISCKTVLDNKDNLKLGKLSFIPTNGTILKKTTVTLDPGSTVFDALKKACANSYCADNCTFCKKSGIQLEYNYTAGYDSYYVEGIHQIYEKDCGTMSGWMFSVNDVFSNYGCSTYKLKDGDSVKWLYTCDMGNDIGA